MGLRRGMSMGMQSLLTSKDIIDLFIFKQNINNALLLLLPVSIEHSD